MLKLAKQSGNYTQLQSADFTKPIEQADDSFDAAISVGVCNSLLDGRFLQELARIIKPGGVIVLSCRPVHFEEHAEADIDQPLRAGRITVSFKIIGYYMLEGNAKAWYVALTALEEAREPNLTVLFSMARIELTVYLVHDG